MCSEMEWAYEGARDRCHATTFHVTIVRHLNKLDKTEGEGAKEKLRLASAELMFVRIKKYADMPSTYIEPVFTQMLDRVILKKVIAA